MVKKSLFMVFLSLPALLYSQDQDSIDSLRAAVMQAAREIISSSPTCALITINENGYARVRTMDPFLPDENFVVWLATNPKSRKVTEIRSNAKVSLYYSGNDSSGYVTLYGRARIVDDQSEKDKRWKEEWANFYPNRSSDYLLLQVIPETLEVINYHHGIYGDPVTWKPVSIQINTH